MPSALIGECAYVHIRKWTRHRTKGVWCPTKRGFVAPLADAEDLAYGIQAAARGHATERPDWPHYRMCPMSSRAGILASISSRDGNGLSAPVESEHRKQQMGSIR